MTNDERRFRRLVLVSLGIHACVLPAFSLVLPARSRPRRIEVVLMTPSEGPRPARPVKIEPSPEIPRLRPRAPLATERIFVADEQDVLRKAVREALGVPEPPVLAARVPENADVVSGARNVAVDRIRFPEIASPFAAETPGAPRGESGVSEEISGPGGRRLLVHKERIQYPDWARARGLEGNVRIRFWVEADGKISETELLGSSGAPDLDVSVEETFRRWLFDRTSAGGRVWGVVTFRLRLR